VIGRLYAAQPADLPALIADMSAATRAQLAVYCSRRAHLTAIGLAIAGHCSASDLENEAGRAGLRLFEQARERRDIAAGPFRGRRAVSLSTEMLRSVVPDDDGDPTDPVVSAA